MIVRPTSEEVVKKQQERDKKRIERRKNDLRKILSIPEGRRFYWELLTKAGVFRTSFTGTSTTYFNEGKREIGLQLLAELMEVKPEAFTQMQREYKSLQKEENKEV